jgi:hypothetical protein
MTLAQDVGDLVLQNGKHSGLEAGSAGKCARVLECPHQGFLHGAFSLMRVTQMQRCELDHLSPQRADLKRINFWLRSRLSRRSLHHFIGPPGADLFDNWLRAALQLETRYGTRKLSATWPQERRPPENKASP